MRKIPEARRLEVLVLRRLPAVAARLRGRAARGRRRRRHRLLPRGDEPDRARAVRRLARRGLDHDARTTRSASARSARQSKVLITIGACATAGGIQALKNFADVTRVRRRSSTRHPSTSPRSPRRRRSPTTSRSTSSCAAARSTSASCSRSSPRSSTAARPNVPGYSVCMECKRRGTTCVMVAHGTPCLGPGHAGRLRRDLPVVRARLLRLLRPDGDTEHRLASPRRLRELGMSDPALVRVLPHLQRERTRPSGRRAPPHA